MYRKSRAFAVRLKHGWWGYYKQRLYEEPFKIIHATMLAILLPTLMYLHFTDENLINDFYYHRNAREYMKNKAYQIRKAIPEDKMVYELI